MQGVPKPSEDLVPKVVGQRKVPKESKLPEDANWLGAQRVPKDSKVERLARPEESHGRPAGLEESPERPAELEEPPARVPKPGRDSRLLEEAMASKAARQAKDRRALNPTENPFLKARARAPRPPGAARIPKESRARNRRRVPRHPSVSKAEKPRKDVKPTLAPKEPGPRRKARPETQQRQEMEGDPPKEEMVPRQTRQTIAKEASRLGAKQGALKALRSPRLLLNPSERLRKQFPRRLERGTEVWVYSKLG